MAGRGFFRRWFLDWLVGVPNPDELLNDSRHDLLRHFFPSSSAADHQLAALKKFKHMQRKIHEQVLAQATDSQEYGDNGSSGDLLIVGEPKTGKTDTLVACLVFATWVMGQESLLVVADETKHTQALERLGRVVDDLEIRSLIEVSALNESTFEQWLKQSNTVPHIMVATWTSVKTLWRSTSPSFATPSFSGCNVSWPLIAVDDLLDFAPSELPLLVEFRDRQRMLLAEVFRPCQLLWTVTPPENWDATDFARRELRWPGFQPEHNCIWLVP